MDKAKMENKIREAFQQNWGAVFTGEGYKISFNKGICSDHQSKEKGDCCREAVREAARKDSTENKKV